MCIHELLGELSSINSPKINFCIYFQIKTEEKKKPAKPVKAAAKGAAKGAKKPAAKGKGGKGK